MKDFTNLYPVSKTLRFELQPIGKTKENIEKNGILQRDEKRAEDYKLVKGFIDEYHKQFIKDRLWNFELPLHSEGHLDSLEEYQALYELATDYLTGELRTGGVPRDLDKASQLLEKGLQYAQKQGDSEYVELFNTRMIQAKELIERSKAETTTEEGE